MKDAIPAPVSAPVAQLSDHELQAAWFWCLIDQDPLHRHQQILDEMSRRQIGGKQD